MNVKEEEFNKKSNTKEIIKRLLDKKDEVLTQYKNQINKHKLG